ncbi:MAG: T9SS type A sorting domain-containing protein [Bacteroidales bacterium]|nr:T9SS type A sorting domain-containing protein [Bacteroidales bacterium]
MKPKTILLVIFLLVGSKTTFSQLNPIQNLQLSMTYDYPDGFLCPAYHCFLFTWDIPNPLADTLLGYNLYKNNVYWFFTLTPYVECLGESTCEHMDIFDTLPCYYKVKAVYNYDSLESVANDSIYIEDIAIGINEQERNTFTVLKNPVSRGEQITLQMADNISGNYIITIASVEGQLVYESKTCNLADHVVKIRSDQLHPGLYILLLQTDNKIISSKVIIK